MLTLTNQIINRRLGPPLIISLSLALFPNLKFMNGILKFYFLWFSSLYSIYTCMLLVNGVYLESLGGSYPPHASSTPTSEM